MAKIVMAKEMSLSYSGNTISYCQSFQLKIGKEPIEISSLQSGGWKEFQSSGEKGWEISFTAMVTKEDPASTYTDYDTILNSLLVYDYGVDVVMSAPTGASTLTGEALLTSLDADISTGGIVTYSGTLQGTGELVIS